MSPRPTHYDLATAARRADRPHCHHPEVAIIGADPLPLATRLRHAGIATATYLVPLRRQMARAKADGPDLFIYADTLKARDRYTAAEWHLNPDHPVESVLFALNCGYLPIALHAGPAQ
jgi:hypothetical protein